MSGAKRPDDDGERLALVLGRRASTENSRFVDEHASTTELTERDREAATARFLSRIASRSAGPGTVGMVIRSHQEELGLDEEGFKARFGLTAEELAALEGSTDLFEPSALNELAVRVAKVTGVRPLLLSRIFKEAHARRAASSGDRRLAARTLKDP